MANQLRQQIEQISREKNINPEVIIAAIEDAILTASKKYYKNDEDLRCPLQRRERADRGLRGEADRGDGRERRDPDRTRGGPEAHPRGRGWPGDRVPEAHRHPGPDRRADRQAGDLPEGARGRARQRLRRVLGPRGRGRERHHQAPGDGRLRRRPGPRRGRAAAQGAEPRRDLPAGRPRPGGDRRAC